MEIVGFRKLAHRLSVIADSVGITNGTLPLLRLIRYYISSARGNLALQILCKEYHFALSTTGVAMTQRQTFDSLGELSTCEVSGL